MPQGLPFSNIEAALFDVDGTLVDSLKVFVNGLGDTYEQFLGFRPSEAELRKLCGIPLKKQLQLFQDQPPSEHRLDEMVDYAISRYGVHEHLELVFEPAVEALRLCNRTGIKTALVTSKNAKELDSFLQRFSGADSVDCTVCASDVLNPKPHPESAILACAKLGVDPSRSIFIGDSIYDLQCASSAGLTSIAVGYGASDRAALLAEQPALYIEEPAELLHWMRETLLQPTCQERK